ncbi:MAG TPA: MFS transporter [Streptosporangiaceae bacterium]|nr:MFS transporter [Streptosporangiaceae bacterium]
MQSKRNTQPAAAGSAVLAAALAVELVDELVDGAKSAALPLIRQGLDLSYGEVGLLASVPLVLGSLLELPLGILAGQGRGRRWAVLAGGLVFIGSLAVVAAAYTFAGLLAAFVIFCPASGAFVGLTQSSLMDGDPGRREQHMARWELAGSSGSVAGPFLLIAVLAAGGGWRPAFLVLAAAAAVTWLAVARNPPRPPSGAGAADPAGAAGAAAGDANGPVSGPPLRRVLAALRRGDVVRWLVLLQVCDLLLDVLTGFVALYLVSLVHATPQQAALGVGIRLGAGLAGDAAVIWALRHVRGVSLLRAGAAAACVLFPLFLLVPGLAAKLVLLAALTLVTAPWYPLLAARLYESLPGDSGVAVTLSSAASLVGGAGPLTVGFLAERFGLGWALAGLAVTAPLVLAGLSLRSEHRPGAGGSRDAGRPAGAGAPGPG